MKVIRACNVCGTMHPVDEMTEFDDNMLCDSCLNAETVRCVQCGERIWRECNEGDDHTPLCQRCYDHYYTTCEDCGRIIHHDDAYYIDEDDYEARCYSCHCRHGNQRVIQDYYYKPEPVFFGKGNRYFGVELDIKQFL